MSPVYLDWNATAPPLPTVIHAVAEASSRAWANPSSVHSLGSEARRTVERARTQIAELMACRPLDIVFTSGGTEANNLALRSHLSRVSHVLCSKLEHPSALRVVEAAADHQIHWLPIDEAGRVDADVVAQILQDLGEPALVVIQSVNHETGVIQPADAIVRCAHEYGAVVHVDAVQAVGKLRAIPGRDADTLSLSAHKFRGPKGIGALVGAGCGRLTPLLLGGSQERKIRPGTSSPPLAAGFGSAASWAREAPERYDAIQVLRDHLQDELVTLGARVNGGEPRVPHVVNLSFDEIRGDELVAALDVEGVCVSSGSACSAGSPEASAVVTAMHGSDRGRTAVRLSLGDETTKGDVDTALAALRRVLRRCRGDG
ncbi:MAG: cysteine desulfurase family protein, partial [Myxococcota bacterium]